MEIYKDLSSTASKEFENYLIANFQIELKKAKLLREK